MVICMTEFLVKKFVKDYDNTGNAKVRSAYGILSGCVGVICNMEGQNISQRLLLPSWYCRWALPVLRIPLVKS